MLLATAGCGLTQTQPKNVEPPSPIGQFGDIAVGTVSLVLRDVLPGKYTTRVPVGPGCNWAFSERYDMANPTAAGKGNPGDDLNITVPMPSDAHTLIYVSSNGCGVWRLVTVDLTQAPPS